MIGARTPPGVQAPRFPYASAVGRLALLLSCAAMAAALLPAAAPAAPRAGASATKRCTGLASKLVRLTRSYKRNPTLRGVDASSTPVCFDFTGDGRLDVAFGILSGGTAGPTDWAVFRGVKTSSKRLSARYRKIAERFSGSKTRLLRRKRQVVVQTPIYKREDANCCPTGGATRVYYRIERSRVVLLRTRTLSPREAGQVR